MATIVPLVGESRRSNLGGAMGKGAADMLNAFVQQRKQKAFSSAIQEALKTSQNQNEFVGKTASFASNPQEVQQLYSIAGKAFPVKEPVENVVEEVFESGTGIRTGVTGPKGKPFTEQQLGERGLTRRSPLRDKPEQFYKRQANDLVPVGRPTKLRPANAVTANEHEAIYGKPGARKAAERKAAQGAKPSDLEKRALANIRARNKDLPPERQRPETEVNKSLAIAFEGAKKDAEDLIKESYRERFGKDWESFGPRKNQAARALELVDRALWERPSNPEFHAREAMRQAEVELPLKDAGASVQEKTKPADDLRSIFSGFFGGSDQPKAKIPPDFALPAELASKSDRDVAKFLAQQFSLDPKVPEDLEEIRAWLKTRQR